MMEKWKNGLDLIGLCLKFNDNAIPIPDPVFHRSSILLFHYRQFV